ncbi:MAG TPA: TGS domain-containing protein, partial [Caldithrix sp.]|nr:TGS domain-containing protein [Caldithrix sp.]
MDKKIRLTFPDGSVREYNSGVTGSEIVEQLNRRLAKEATGIVVNGVLKSLPEHLTEDAEIRFVTFDDKEGRYVFWHSSAHLMAHAVKRLFPEAKLGIGPPIEDGFYYDI